MTNRKFKPGFRLSAIDVAVLVLGSVAAAYLSMQISLWLGLGVAFVVAHFFLFCNVFRVARPLELGWSAVFVTLVLCCTLFAVPSWPLVFALTLPATIAVIGLEMSKASYHGVLWQSINPQLPDWWEAQLAK